MYHFVNCAALTFLPHVILYRATKLMEESGFRSCLFAAIGYAATQAVKLLLMATLVPSSSSVDSLPVAISSPSQSSSSSSSSSSHAGSPVPGVSLTSELLTCLVSVVELFGIQLILQMAPNLSKFHTHTRILAVAIGWSFAESLAFYLIPLWIGARGMEFSWQYIELALSSNVNLVFHFALCAAVWLRTRTDISKSAVPVVYSLLALGLTLPSITQYALHVLDINSWAVLAARAVVSVTSALIIHMLLSQYGARPAANKYKNN